MSAKTVVDVLRDARALVAKGWAQGTYYNDGCYCSSGAVLRALGGNPETGMAWPVRREYQAREVLRLLDRAVGAKVERWNDTPGRTKAEVLAAFDKAIEAAEVASRG